MTTVLPPIIPSSIILIGFFFLAFLHTQNILVCIFVKFEEKKPQYNFQQSLEFRSSGANIANCQEAR